jgi:methionyl-tRNA formyltransferase
MAMEKGLDTGPVFARRRRDRSQDAGELTVELADISGRLMVEVLERWTASMPVTSRRTAYFRH